MVKAVAASKTVQAQVTRIVNDEGVVRAAATFGLARETLLRVAAGVKVNPGTLALVREKLEGMR